MKKIIILLVFCIISPLAFGDIILQTNTTSPSINNPFILQVNFNNESKQKYKIKGIEDFEILSQSSQSSFSVINGKKSSSQSDTYQVLPTKKGKFDLEVISNDSKTLSNKLTLNVTENSTTAPINKNVELETNLKNNASFYFGEKIPFYEKFLSTIQINSLGYKNPPKFENFSYKEITPVDSNGQYKQEYFHDKNGNTGIAITTFESVLMPDSSGEKNIYLGQLGYTLPVRDDFFFNSSSSPKYLGGKNIHINILPLPDERPTGFQNIVGSPKIEYSWNKDKITYGDSTVLTLTIKGAVNLDSLEKIFPQDIPNFNIFENIKDSSETIKDGKYYATKTFDIAFIPKSIGSLETPNITIPYFDTKAKSFKELSIPSKKIIVEKSLNNPTPNIQQSTGNNNNTPQQPTEYNSTPSEIKISTLGSDNSSNKFNNSLIIGLIVLVILETGVIIYLLANKNRKNESIDLSILEKSKNIQDFYQNYCAFMKDKFKFSPKVHLNDKLVRLGFSDDFIELNNELEEAYFSNKEINIKETVKKIKKELKNVK